MKILFCTNKFDEVTNGPAKFANLILEINKIYPKHELRILTEDAQVPNPYIYKLQLKYPAILSLLSQFIRMWAYHRKAREIWHEDFRFDVIVYNNAFIGLISAMFFPYCIGMINDDNNACRNWYSFQFNYVYIKQFIFKQFERLAIRFHYRIITNSDYLTNYLEQVYPGIKGKVFKLYKAIETPSYIRPIDFSNIIPHILFVKADYRRGGLFDLIAALEFLDQPFKLIIIGPEDKEKTAILNRITSTKLSINFLGPQTQDIVFNQYLKADVFCVPSHREALGVANLEAMARGVPVVATSVGGIPEILDKGKNGWLVQARNTVQLAETIKACLGQKEKRKLKIMNGLEYSQQFLSNKMFEQFIQILDRDHAKPAVK